MAKTCGIYIITNPIGQVYIGASTCIESRVSYYKNLFCWKYQEKMFLSILTFGWDCHKVKILKKCEKDKLGSYEKYYVDKFKCFNNKNSLNMRDGGGPTSKWSEESKDKVKGKNNHFYGKKHSKKCIRKAAEKQMGVLSKKAIKVKQILKNGKTIRIWGCMADAARALNMSRADIVNVCKGNKKSAGGYFWEYA